jgi:hypothetical protein
MGKWIGMVLKTPPAQSQPSYDFHEGQLQSLGAPQEEKWGLSEEQRQQVYGLVGRAEERAIYEADEAFPNFGEKHTEMVETLTAKYHEEVQQKYGLTEDQMTELFAEGFQKNWPTLRWQTETKHGKLGISYSNVMNKLDTYFMMESGAKIDGLENYVGTYKNAMLQVIGERDNLSEVSFTLIADQQASNNAEVAALLSQLLTNIFPQWQDNVTWVSNSVTQLTTSPDTGITKVLDNKTVTMTLSKELGMIITTVTSE